LKAICKKKKRYQGTDHLKSFPILKIGRGKVTQW